MKEITQKQKEDILGTQTLWHQLAPQQREQIAVVVLRILRQWQKQTQRLEVENEPVKLDL